jgi:uncharacterized repeat protein (TIGR02543 family)
MAVAIVLLTALLAVPAFGSVPQAAFAITPEQDRAACQDPNPSALWTVTWHYNNGAANKVERVTSLTVFHADHNRPTYKGHDFLGWYLDEAQTVKVSFPLTVAQSFNLYAKWSGIAAPSASGQKATQNAQKSALTSPTTSANPVVPNPQASDFASAETTLPGLMVGGAAILVFLAIALAVWLKGKKKAPKQSD